MNEQRVIQENGVVQEDVPATVDPGVATDGVGAEVRRGRSPRTPFLALGGVATVVAAVFAVVVAAALLVYFLA